MHLQTRRAGFPGVWAYRLEIGASHHDWAQGGPSHALNLVLLCRCDHRAVDEGVLGRGQGERVRARSLRWPQGRVATPDVPPSPELRGDPRPRARTQHGAWGEHSTRHTATTPKLGREAAGNLGPGQSTSCIRARTRSGVTRGAPLAGASARSAAGSAATFAQSSRMPRPACQRLRHATRARWRRPATSSSRRTSSSCPRGHLDTELLHREAAHDGLIAEGKTFHAADDQHVVEAGEDPPSSRANVRPLTQGPSPDDAIARTVADQRGARAAEIGQHQLALTARRTGHRIDHLAMNSDSLTCRSACAWHW